MKKAALLILFIGVLNSAKAQENVLKINIFSPIVRTASLFYERALNEKSSAQLGFFYTGYKISDTKFSGFGITPEYRYYLTGDDVLRGVYIGPFIRYQNFTLKNTYFESNYDSNGNYLGETEKDGKATLSTIGGGVLIGHQWLFNDKISLDVFLGPSFNAGNLKVNSGSEDVFSTGAFDGFSVRFGLTFGYAF